MSGTQLCKEIKDFLKIPFILYTARESNELTMSSSSCIDDYVHKEPNLIRYSILAKKIIEAVEKNRKT
jgi:DNA-binding response OmpR family regulator